MRGQEKGNGRAQSSGPILKPPKRNHFSTLRSRGEQEESPDVVTSMVQVFFINVYALLDSSVVLQFVTPPVVKKFDVYPIFLLNHFQLQH